MCFKCKSLRLSVNVKGLETELKRVAKLLYNGKLKPGQIDAPMVKLIASQLMNGITKGYTAAGKITSADRSFISELESNIYIFSGFKNHAELAEASALLSDGKGSYKSFTDFYTDIKTIDKTYNEVYLEAEYDHAIASAQSAATYQSYIRNGITILTFRTAGDDNVRSEHAIYEGLTLSIDDPEYDRLSTPLDWGCRCEWEPGDESDLTTVEDWIADKKENGALSMNIPELPKKVFEGNVGKTAKVFPDSHPYFDVDKKTASYIIKQIDAIKKEDE